MGRGARQRAAQVREELEDRWDATQSRLADLEHQVERIGRGEEQEEEGRGMLPVLLGIAAGAGVAYFLMADDTASARSKVQEVASDLRHQATDRWQQFRRGGSKAAKAAKEAASSFSDEV